MLLAEECNGCKRHNNQEQQPCLSARQTHLVALERIVINQHGDQHGRITRSALGNDERSVEFLERLTQLCNQVIENNRGNKRNRNAEELSPFPGAIDGRRLI